MSERMKYIVLSDGTKEYAVIFDQKLAHKNVADGIVAESATSQWSKILGRLTPVSAGFVEMPDCFIDDWTGSESLKLKPRPQDGPLLRGELVAAAPLPSAVPQMPKRSALERAKGARAR